MNAHFSLELDRSKKGLPCLWESGGAGSNTGRATLIAGPQGQRLTALYIPRGGHLSNGAHALVVVKEGYLVVRASQWRGDLSIEVFRVTAIDDVANVARLDRLAAFSAGEWDTDPEDCLMAAVQAAISKSSTYHCKGPTYVNARPIAALDRLAA